MRRRLAAALLCLPALTSAANLDVTAAYRMRALSYENLNLGGNPRYYNNRSFITNDARLGLAVRKIVLETRDGEDVSMDVGIGLRALGVTGSTNALQAPFDRAANIYPSADFTPFIENAYVKVHNLMGKPLDATFGRQTYRLGGGLLLDDDGAGLTGASLRGELPWGGLKLEGFAFHDRNPQSLAPNSLGFYGFSLDLPSEGTWQLNQLFERDRSYQTAYGCFYPGVPATGCEVSQAIRSLTSVRYLLNLGPLYFDGEAAVQRGAATPTGLTPAPNHITYQGNAQVLKAKWKQSLPRTGEGIARISLARGSGDNPGTPTTDEAFRPSHGHRFNGLERSGFGEFFAATPYDAYGGNYASTAAASGLRDGASGILVVGGGYTPAAYRGFALDVDFFLFQAERIRSGSRGLGSEWDLRLRYAIQDHFTLSVSGAWFKSGVASAKASAKKYAFEVNGRF